jgi:hypothetical protein
MRRWLGITIRGIARNHVLDDSEADSAIHLSLRKGFKVWGQSRRKHVFWISRSCLNVKAWVNSQILLILYFVDIDNRRPQKSGRRDNDDTSDPSQKPEG